MCLFLSLDLNTTILCPYYFHLSNVAFTPVGPFPATSNATISLILFSISVTFGAQPSFRNRSALERQLLPQSRGAQGCRAEASGTERASMSALGRASWACAIEVMDLATVPHC